MWGRTLPGRQEEEDQLLDNYTTLWAEGGNTGPRSRREWHTLETGWYLKLLSLVAEVWGGVALSCIPCCCQRACHQSSLASLQLGLSPIVPSPAQNAHDVLIVKWHSAFTPAALWKSNFLILMSQFPSQQRAPSPTRPTQLWQMWFASTLSFSVCCPRSSGTSQFQTQWPLLNPQPSWLSVKFLTGLLSKDSFLAFHEKLFYREFCYLDDPSLTLTS